VAEEKNKQLLDSLQSLFNGQSLPGNATANPQLALVRDIDALK